MSRSRKIWITVYSIALGLGVIYVGVKGELTAETAGDTERIVQTKVVNSACKQDPRGDECQQIFLDMIRAFGRTTTCALGRKLDRVLIGVRLSAVCDSTANKEVSDEAAQGSTSERGSTGGTGSSGAPDPGSGGDGDGSGEPAPTDPSPPVPPPDPPPTNPPNPPEPPSPPSNPSPPSLGDHLGDAVDGATGLGCQVTNVLGVCIR